MDSASAAHAKPDRQIVQEVITWLETFSACVRNLDYTSANNLVHQNAVCFGTFADIIIGREAWVDMQFRQVWPRTRDFRFDVPNAKFFASVDAELVTVIASWASTGFREDGSAFDRPGRATMVLERGGQGWLCIHSHMSLCRGVPQQSHVPDGASRSSIL